MIKVSYPMQGQMKGQRIVWHGLWLRKWQRKVQQFSVHLGNNSGLFDEVLVRSIAGVDRRIADAMFIQFESMVFDGLNTSTV